MQNVIVRNTMSSQWKKAKDKMNIDVSKEVLVEDMKDVGEAIQSIINILVPLVERVDFYENQAEEVLKMITINTHLQQAQQTATLNTFNEIDEELGSKFMGVIFKMTTEDPDMRKSFQEYIVGEMEKGDLDEDELHAIQSINEVLSIANHQADMYDDSESCDEDMPDMYNMGEEE